MERDELEQHLEGLHHASFAWTLACCGGNRAEAEDVLQAAYLKVFDGRARFGGRSSFKTWLFSVIRRTATDRRRRRRWRSLLVDRWLAPAAGLVAGSTPEDDLRQSRQRQRVRRALASITDRQRQVLELVFYHDLSIRQAAEVLNLALGTARVHYERGKKALLAQLREERAHDD